MAAVHDATACKSTGLQEFELNVTVTACTHTPFPSSIYQLVISHVYCAYNVPDAVTGVEKLNVFAPAWSVVHLLKVPPVIVGLTGC